MLRASLNLLLWMQLIPAPAAGQPPAIETAGRVTRMEGVVLQSQTGAPLPGAAVLLAPTGVERQAGYGAVSDAEGKFRFDKVPPGNYRLSAERRGFLRQQYGAKRVGGKGVEIRLPEGGQINDLQISLTPQSAVSGSVTDERGAPLEGVRVRAGQLKVISGSRQLTPAGNPAIGSITDDRGEFRIRGLAPGRYYLAAEFHSEESATQRIRYTSEADRMRIVTTYYPSAEEIEAAMPVELQAGQVLQEIAISMRKRRAYRFAGKVVPPPGEALGRGAKVVLQPVGSTSGADLVWGTGVFAGTDGAFAIDRVPEGQYWLAVVTMMGGPGRVLLREPVGIGARDVTDHVIALPAPGLLKGTLRVEEQAGGPPDWTGVQVEFSSALAPGINPPRAAVERDGSFSLTTLGADVYRLRVEPRPPDFYLATVRLGGEAVPETRIDLTRGGSLQQLELILRRGAALSGLVRDDKAPAGSAAASRALQGATVLLAQTGAPGGSDDALRTAIADGAGRFEFHGVRPGKYRLFAWEDIEPGAWHEPGILNALESAATEVTVSGTGHHRVEVKLIHATGGR